MSKRTLLLLIAAGLLIAIVIALFSLYSASHYVPAFYRQAVAIDPQKQEDASKRMLQQVSALDDALKKKGGWEALFTAEQINGWFAVDMARNHPNALPPTLRNPRVAIGPKQITVACLVELKHYWSVVSLTVEPYLPEPNVLALRIVRARAGLLPVPLGDITHHLTQAAQQLGLHIQWRQTGGDPVAILSLPADRADDGRRVRVETLRLGEGEIYLSGATLEGAADNPRGRTRSSGQ
jgi:hypothetical protein